MICFPYKNEDRNIHLEQTGQQILICHILQDPAHAGLRASQMCSHHLMQRSREPMFGCGSLCSQTSETHTFLLAKNDPADRYFLREIDLVVSMLLSFPARHAGSGVKCAVAQAAVGGFAIWESHEVMTNGISP